MDGSEGINILIIINRIEDTTTFASKIQQLASNHCNDTAITRSWNTAITGSWNMAEGFPLIDELLLTSQQSLIYHKPRQKSKLS